MMTEKYIEAQHEIQDLVKTGLEAIYRQQQFEDQQRKKYLAKNRLRWGELREQHRGMLPAELRSYLSDKPGDFYETFTPITNMVEWEIQITGLVPIQAVFIDQSWDGRLSHEPEWKLAGYVVAEEIMGKLIFNGSPRKTDLSEILGLARYRFEIYEKKKSGEKLEMMHEMLPVKPEPDYVALDDDLASATPLFSEQMIAMIRGIVRQEMVQMGLVSGGRR